MIGHRWRRRSLLRLGLVGSAVPLLAACSQGRADPSPTTPPPSVSPSPSDVASPRDVPDCIDLADHEFVRGRSYCGGDHGDGDADVVALDFAGPLIATDDTLIAWYIDAVAAWSTADGTLTKLLAPQRADQRLFATVGAHTVVPQCDGKLVVHADGCRVLDLDGHPEGVIGLVAVDDKHLVSLGSDADLRLWDVSAPEPIAAHELDTSADGLLLGVERTGGVVTVSGADRLRIFDGSSLEPREDLTDLPATSGWVLSPTGGLIGEASGSGGVLIHDPASGQSQRVETTRDPLRFAISNSGVLAVVQGIHLHVRRPDGATAKHRLEDPTYHTGSAVFSPDETALHILDAHSGLASVDIATGRRLTTYSQPSV